MMLTAARQMKRWGTMKWEKNQPQFQDRFIIPFFHPHHIITHAVSNVKSRSPYGKIPFLPWLNCIRLHSYELIVSLHTTTVIESAAHLWFQNNQRLCLNFNWRMYIEMNKNLKHMTKIVTQLLNLYYSIILSQIVDTFTCCCPMMSNKLMKFHNNTLGS